MKKSLVFALMMFGCILLFACQSAAVPAAPAAQEQAVTTMSITGEIAQGANAYIIRGQTPAEIFTILNPDPMVLDELVTSAKVVHLEVRIVSGDNVEIQTIDGKKYQPKGQ